VTYADLKALFRRQIHDDVQPYFFQDLDLDMAANEGIREACYRAKLILDSTSAATQIALTSATTSVALSRTIFQIVRAHIVGGGHAIMTPRSTAYLDENVYGWRDKSGEPATYTLDENTWIIRPHPKPDKNYTLALTVYRYPSAADTLVEIPEDCHYDLIHWIEHRYYMRRDIDSFDKTRSIEAEMLFTERFGPRLNRNSQAHMMQNAPMTAGVYPLA
jgi:hypothetical protein